MTYFIIYVSKGVKKMKMDREGAVIVLYDIINSGIISDELEQKLIDIANAIENDSFVGEIEEKSNGRGC